VTPEPIEIQADVLVRANGDKYINIAHLLAYLTVQLYSPGTKTMSGDDLVQKLIHILSQLRDK
jgi:hypothetical protein